MAKGDRMAEEQLIPLVYNEPRRLAGSLMRNEPPDHTLQTTALVHQAYLRLVAGSVIDWSNRAHFFAVAATVMRCTCGGGSFAGGVKEPAGRGTNSGNNSGTSYRKSRFCIRTLTFALRGHTSKVRTVCVRSARTDLCGGCRATGTPTATGGLSGRPVSGFVPKSTCAARAAVL